jgi:hypothetical protein
MRVAIVGGHNQDKKCHKDVNYAKGPGVSSIVNSMRGKRSIKTDWGSSAV